MNAAMSPSVTPPADMSDIGAPFWQGLRERRLMLQFDAVTGRAQFYPRPQSLSGSQDVSWRQASGRGTLAALTLSRVAPPWLAAQVPYVLALVALEEGPRLLARVLAPFEALRIGQAVEVAWDDLDPQPAFPVFKPCGRAADPV